MNQKTSFFGLIQGKDAAYIAMLILTVLDMANKGVIKFDQESQFDDVTLERIKEDEN